MKEKLLAWLFKWALDNLSKEVVDKLMREKVLPFLRSKKHVLKGWLAAWAADPNPEKDVDDVVAEVAGWVLDALLPDA